MSFSTTTQTDDVRTARQVHRYTTVAIALHWMIALAIIAMLATGLWMVDAIKEPSTQALAFQTYQFHKSLGLAILVLSLLRLGWRLFNKPPPLPGHMSSFQRTASNATHVLFYVLMIGMPLTGWAMVSASPLGLPTIVFGWFEWPHIAFLEAATDKAAVAERFKLAHMYAGYLMLALAALHIAAALKHQFIDKDNLLARMAPIGPRRSSDNEVT
ncbi:MAG: cytochrome b [Pseudomonadota bacterium]